MQKRHELESAQATVLAFIRGELPWEEVESLGIRMERTDDGFDVTNTYQLVVKASLRDIATGSYASVIIPRHCGTGPALFSQDRRSSSSQKTLRIHLKASSSSMHFGMRRSGKRSTEKPSMLRSS